MIVLAAQNTVVVRAMHAALQVMLKDPTQHQVIEVVVANQDDLHTTLERLGHVTLRSLLVVQHWEPYQSLDPWQTTAIGRKLGAATESTLSFPEVAFLFRHPFESNGRAKPCCIEEFAKKAIAAAAQHGQEDVPWFDRTGIRMSLKLKLAEEQARSESPNSRAAFDQYLERIEKRKSLAIVAEDERLYAMLAGYVAYLSGYSVQLLVTHSAFDSWNKEGQPGELLVHDLHLGYYDLESADPTEAVIAIQLTLTSPDPTGAVNAIQSTPTSVKKRVVLSANADADDPTNLNIANVKKSELDVERLRKAIERFPRTNEGDTPKQRSEKPSDSAINRHPPSPFRRMMIAERLLERARRISGSSHASVEDSLHQSLLALEAEEILLGAGGTELRLESIALRHLGEVGAEGDLWYSQSQLAATDRVSRLRKEANIALETTTNKKDSANAFMVRALLALRARYVSLQQVEAVDDCAKPLWDAEIDLVSCRVVRASRLYLQFVTDSGTSAARVLITGLLFAVLFGIIFTPIWGPAKGLSFGLHTFVQLGPGNGEMWQDVMKCTLGANNCVGISPLEAWMTSALVWLEVLVSYIQLAILTSLVFRRVAR